MSENCGILISDSSVQGLALCLTPIRTTSCNYSFLCKLLTADSCVAHLFPAKEGVKFRHNCKLTVSKNRLLPAPLTVQSPQFLPLQEIDEVYTECPVPFYLYTFRM